MKQCFGYIRVSTQKQGEGVSLEAQKDAITAFASRQNLAVTEWFEEKETAAKSGRPVFNQMLKALRRGAASGIIMHKIDRSARNLKDWAIISELPDAGIDVHIATESYDFRSRGGRLTADIQAVIAADYIRNLREETIKGLTGRLKQGLYPFKAPIGYRDNGRGQPKTICPIKGPLVREALLSYAAGEHSIRSLHRELVRRGLKNHAGQPISQHNVEAMLANPFYCGRIEIKRSGAVYDGIHEPLIDRNTFKRIQDRKAGKAGKKVSRHNHLYRGLFRCRLCAGPLSPERQKGRVYYRCQQSDCPMATIREDRLEAAIVAKLKTLELSAANADMLEATWRQWMESDERQQALRSIELRIEECRRKQDRLTDLLIEGTLPQDDYEQRRRGLLIELSDLEAELDTASKQDLTPEQMRKFLELMKTLSSLYISAKPAEKRRMVENAFSNRSVCPENVYLEPHNWLLEVKNASGVSDGDPKGDSYRTFAQLLPDRLLLQRLERRPTV